jgi:multiple sugar transport system substrate-binding protein
MKKVLALVLALIMVLSLCACGSKSAPAEEAPAEEPTEVPEEAKEPEEGVKDFGGKTIRLAMWGDNSRKDVYDPIFAPFEEKYNVNVEIEVYTNSEYATKILTEVGGGTGPDVVWLTERYYPMFADAGILADMNPLMDDPEYKFDDYSVSLANNYIKDGNLTAIPFTANPLAFYYNATMFKDAGLETPLELYNKGEWTIDKMLECAKTLTDKESGKYGLSLVQTVDPTNWPTLLDYFWALGVDFFNEDTTACTVNNEAGIEAIQRYYDLMFTEGSCVVPGEMVSFESGNLAMYPGNASEGKNYQGVDFDWDYICYPANNDNKMINIVGVALYAVLNTTENYDAALEVVKYVTSEEIQSQLSDIFTPTRESLKNSDAFLNITESMPSPEGRKILYVDVFANDTKTYPATSNWNDINIAGKNIFDMLYTGDYTAEQVAAEFDTQLNALLKK